MKVEALFQNSTNPENCQNQLAEALGVHIIYCAGRSPAGDLCPIEVLVTLVLQPFLGKKIQIPSGHKVTFSRPKDLLFGRSRPPHTHTHGRLSGSQTALLGTAGLQVVFHPCVLSVREGFETKDVHRACSEVNARRVSTLRAQDSSKGSCAAVWRASWEIYNYTVTSSITHCTVTLAAM